MKCYLGSDHGAVDLKRTIAQWATKKPALDIVDIGVFSNDSVDYPDIASQLAEAVLKVPGSVGVLACGTGIGMSMRANRYQGIRAALVHNQETARLAKEHNNANILCLGGRVLAPSDALDCIDIWLASQFLGERHLRRINKLDCS